MKHFDVGVVGGGIAGLASALALSRQGANVVLIAPEPPRDHRTSALMLPVCDIMANWGIFAEPGEMGVPLNRIRLIDATSRLLRAPETVFDAQTENLSAFSYNFPNADLTARILELLADMSNFTRITSAAERIDRKDGQWTVLHSAGGNVDCRLLVGADGKASLVRSTLGISQHSHAFAQSALVCDLELERPLDGESVEFHYENGPFTLVPAGDHRANLVWVDREKVLHEAKLLDAPSFNRLLVEKSQGLFGDISSLTPSFIFPLATQSANSAGREGAILVGEAAHAFPPIGAQGLNLGLRDVAELDQLFKQADRGTDDWAVKLSADYAERRAPDIGRTTGFVDGLFHSLLSDLPPVQIVRSAGIWALKTLPFLRRQAFRTGMGAR